MDAGTTLQRPWTFMVYMAGDNGKLFDTAAGPLRLMAAMEGAGYRDLMKMGTVGTTDRCAVACLFDTPAGSYRVEVRRGAGFADSLVEAMPGVNTGDPAVLSDFIIRTVRAYPADRTILVIWNHGTGWLDTDLYAPVRALEPGHRTHAAVFRSTLSKMSRGRTRAIAYDDSSKDFLDAQGLRQAFAQAEAATGRRLDIIGMDACLMAMVEGATELAPFAGYFVGSQEVEPLEGWPYGPILEALNATPDMTPGVLADAIVRQYAASYHALTRAEVETITQSAIDLDAAAETEALCQTLVDAVLIYEKDAVLRSLIRKVRNQTLVFQDKNYRDLGDFAARTADATEWENYPEVNAASRKLAAHLRARPAGTVRVPVLQIAYRPSYQAATGLSVYLPSTGQPADERREALEIYRGLLFPQRTGWDRLLAWLDREF